MTEILTTGREITSTPAKQPEKIDVKSELSALRSQVEQGNPIDTLKAAIKNKILEVLADSKMPFLQMISALLKGMIKPDATPASSSQTPEKGKESSEQVIPGRIGLFGDSLLAGIRSQLLPSQNGMLNLAVPSQTTYGLRQKIADNSGEIKKLDQGVILIGTNDIGGTDSAGEIAARIKDLVFRIRQQNPGIKLKICTIPPFAGYKGSSRYSGSNFAQTDQKRRDINQEIINFVHADPSLQLIPLHNNVNDPVPGISKKAVVDGREVDSLALSSFDHLHPSPQELAKYLSGYFDRQQAAPVVSSTAQVESSASSSTQSTSSQPTYPRRLTSVERAGMVDRMNFKGQYRPADHKNPVVVSLAKKLQREWLASGIPYGHVEMVTGADGKIYQARVREHDYQARTGKTGKFYGVEIWEPNNSQAKSSQSNA